MKRLVPFALAAALFASSGCHLFSKKKASTTPKESKTVAADVEKDFMARWIEKRTNDLESQGRSPQMAHDQAVAEFRAEFTYTEASKQAR
jgi:hypothetical protein